MDRTTDSEYDEISTEELGRQLDRPGWVVVDVRESTAYNGWRLEGEARGGHIQGAVDLPTSWVVHASEPEVRLLLEAKGITAGKTIVVYDARGDKSPAMARLLRGLGYPRVRAYSAGLAAWAADDSLPMDHLPRFEKLVHPHWLGGLVQGSDPETRRDKGFALLEVGWEARRAYQEAHLPSAIYLDTGALEQAPLWNRVPDGALEAALLAHGVTSDTTVVLYGKDMLPPARAALLLMFAGVEDVRLLDGGFAAWVSAGYGVEQGTRRARPANAFGRKLPAHPEYIVGMEEVRAMLADKNAVVVSVRSWAEYVGETSGYDDIEPKGRIAGAVWGQASSGPNSLEQLQNADHTMRNYHEIAAHWRDWGITPDKKVAFYCGTGWRASQAFFYAYLMGWERISVYDGGWREWSADPTNPVASGVVRRTGEGLFPGL